MIISKISGLYFCLLVLIIPIVLFSNGFAVHSALAQNVTNNTKSSSTSSVQAKTVGRFLTYSNPSYGIKIQFPSNWVVSRSGLIDYSNIVAFYSPLENITDKFPEHLILSATVYSKNITLNEYKTVINQTLQLPGLKVLNSTSTTLAHNPAHILLVSTTSNRTGLALDTVLVYTVKGNIAYTISFNSEAAKFSQYWPVVERMLNSIELGNPRLSG